MKVLFHNDNESGKSVINVKIITERSTDIMLKIVYKYFK